MSTAELRHLSVVNAERAAGEYDRLVRKLRAAGYVGADESVGDDFKCLCPLHENKGKHAPSLHVTKKDDGGVWVWCGGSCDRDSVWSGIMDEDAVLAPCKAERIATGRGDGGVLVSAMEIASEKMYHDWCRQEASETGVSEAGSYVYRSMVGVDVAVKVKWTNKEFTWLHWNGSAWRRGLKGGSVPLYRADEIAESSGTVYVVEGEKDADRLVAGGLVATSSVVVTRDWSQLELLMGRVVVVVPDRDEAGDGTARRFAIWAARKGAAQVRLMDPCGDESSSPGYDISDWLDAGGSVAELEWMASNDEQVEVVEVEDVVDSGDGAPVEAEIVDPDVMSEADRSLIEQRKRTLRREQIARQELAADLFVEPPADVSFSLADGLAMDWPEHRYYIEKIFAERHIVTLVGRNKSGKTTLSGNVVRSLVDGVPFMNTFEAQAIAGNVGMWNAEMDAQDYVDYLKAIGIKRTDKVMLVNMAGRRMNLMSDEGMDWTINWLQQNEVEVWIPDPLSKILSWCGVEENDNTGGKSLQTRLEEIMLQSECVKSLFIPTHPPRGADGQDGMDIRTRGASVWDDWPSAKWMYKRDGDQRYLEVEGRNVGLESVGVSFDPGTGRLGMIEGGRREVKASAIGEKVLTVLSEQDGASTNTIMDSIDKNRNDVSSALKQLEKKNLVHSVSGPRNAKNWYSGPDPAIAWALKSGDEVG